jgi:hypothetical protein
MWSPQARKYLQVKGAVVWLSHGRLLRQEMRGYSRWLMTICTIGKATGNMDTKDKTAKVSFVFGSTEVFRVFDMSSFAGTVGWAGRRWLEVSL